MCCSGGRGLRILLETVCEVGLGHEWGLSAIAVSLGQRGLLEVRYAQIALVRLWFHFCDYLEL